MRRSHDATGAWREFAGRPAVAVALFLLLGAAWVVLGLAILTPDAVYSGDIGVKFVQARALAAARFTSLDIPYPGAFLDPTRTLFPMRPPFVMTAGGATQAIFPPASAVVQGMAVGVAGMRGMILVSLVSGLIVLLAAWAQAERRQEAAVLMALGVASPLWFYAVSGWEHAPAIALSTLAFAWGMRGPGASAPLIAGLALGAGATLRDEVLLLAPGLLVLAWMRARTSRALMWTVAGLLLPLAGAALLEVVWFKRPLAAHLRHAVHLLQTALHTTDAPNPDVPVLRPLTLRERYETVIQYWLLGYGQNLWITSYAAALVLALALRWWRKTSLGLLAWLVAVIGLAALDLRELVTAPKWLAGLHRVSPYLAIALFPLPAGSGSRGWYVPVTLLTVAAYLALAFVGADTSGGKSLGPRLLLPLLPMLTVAAISTIWRYRAAVTRVDRAIGYAGLVLIAMSAGMHVLGTIPAYVERNRGDAEAIVAVARSPERIVVADDPFTAQLLFPLYYRKIVFLADTPELGQAMGATLQAQRVTGAVVVSRQEQPGVALPPLALERTEQRGRMTIQYWKHR
jgi:hypothetical protein